MDGGVADTTCYFTGRSSAAWGETQPPPLEETESTTRRVECAVLPNARDTAQRGAPQLGRGEEGMYRRRERFRVSADKFCSADSSAAGALRASPVQRA